MSIKQIYFPKAPQVIYIFGLTGVGQTFVGKIFSEFAGYYLYEADETLPKEMREAVEKNLEWTETQLDGYYDLIKENILDLIKVHPKIVITQATYFQRHRDMMIAAILLLVTADYGINVKRIKERNDFVTVEYFKLSRRYFEPAKARTKVLENNTGKAEIIKQLQKFYA